MSKLVIRGSRKRTKVISELFSSVGFQVLSNGSLRIHHLQIQDTGYYLCWAENLVRRTYGQVRLEVQGNEKFIVSSQRCARPSSSTVDRSARTRFHRNGRPIAETLLSSQGNTRSQHRLARRLE